MKKTVMWGLGGLRIELDPDEIVPDDPGQGTPAMVIHHNGDVATFHCALATGELSDGTKLTDEQKWWLMRQEERVDRFIENGGDK